MGRAGGAGGGRSGGSSSHSTGRSSSGGSRSSSGGSRPSSSHSSFSHSSRPSGGGFGGGGHRPPPSRHSLGGHRPPTPPPSGGGYRGHRPHYRSSGYYSGGSGGLGIRSCLTSLICIFGVIALIFILLLNFRSCSYSTQSGNPNTQIHASQTANYKTSKGTYFEDHLEMQLDTKDFNSNMKLFEDKVGSKPFLYTCERVNGKSAPSDEDFETFTEQLYSDLKLKNTVLMVYQESDENWGVWVYMDNEVTEAKFPDESIDKLYKFVEDNYEGSYTNAELFSLAFVNSIP